MKQVLLITFFIFTLFACDKHECLQLKSNMTNHPIVGWWECYKIDHKGDIIENIRNTDLEIYNEGGVVLNAGGGMFSILGGVGLIDENTVTVQDVRHNPDDEKDYIDIQFIFEILKISDSELIIRIVHYRSDNDIGDIWYFTRINNEPI